MSLDTVILLIFIAGLLAGIGVAILASLVPDLIAALRGLAAHARRRDTTSSQTQVR